MSKNFLDFDRREKLLNWMRLNRDLLCTFSKHEAAKKATEELGFPVSYGNCDGMKRHANVTFARKITKRANGHGRRVSGRALELHQIRVVQIQHAKYIAKLYDELQLPYGPDLRLLATADLKVTE